MVVLGLKKRKDEFESSIKNRNFKSERRARKRVGGPAGAFNCSIHEAEGRNKNKKFIMNDKFELNNFFQFGSFE